jgi:hypothetical protein
MSVSKRLRCCFILTLKTKHMSEFESELSPTLEIEIDTEAQRMRHYEDARSIGCSRSIWSQVLGVVDLVECMGNCGPAALVAKLPEITVLIPGSNHEFILSFQASGFETPTVPLTDKFELNRRSLDHPGDVPEKLMEGYFGSLVDLTRVSSWILDGQEPQLTEYQRLVRMHEEGQRRGIC